MAAIALTVLAVALLAALAVLAWLVRDRREVRALVGAERGQETAVAVRRLLRRRVDRDELSAALFAREATLEATPLPVLVVGADGIIGRVNGAARAALGGIDAGARVDEISPSLARAIAGVLTGPPVATAEAVAGPEGRVWLAHLRSHPLLDGQRGAVAVLVDVSESVDYRESRRLFSAAVSHELRTPLQRIVGIVDTLALPLTDDERHELARDAEREVERMRELIDEMLLLAALDRGELGPTEGDSDVGEVVRAVVATRQARAHARGMLLALETAPDLRVRIVQRLLEVVVGNVIDNALNYAGDGAAVTVSVRGRAGEVEIVVTDTGVGIPAEHLPHVFERFFRGEASRSSPGSGLGLALVKHVVESHGGRATIQSRPGEGTTLRLLFPEVRVPASA